LNCCGIGEAEEWSLVRAASASVLLSRGFKLGLDIRLRTVKAARRCHKGGLVAIIIITILGGDSFVIINDENHYNYLCVKVQQGGL
jgi:hypothetical protein